MENEEKIKILEEEIRNTPYHKGTEHHIGRLKGRIAKLKEEILQNQLKSSGGGGRAYAVKKSGDATVILVGPPSVGKSTLINQITNAQSKTASYAFTTTEVIPGMMDYKGAKIQIFDVPGIIKGASEGKGRGKEVLSVVRTADLIIIMVDALSVDKVKEIKDELYKFGIRTDEEKPKVTFIKKSSGGVKISSFSRLANVSDETIKELASEFRFRNGEIIIKENITLERLIDAFMANRSYLNYLVVVNKIDLAPSSTTKNLDQRYVFVSAKKAIGLDILREKIWESLGLIRVYLKPEKGGPDLNNPLIIKKGISLRKILEDEAIPGKENFTKAIIYGPGAKFPGQEVSCEFTPLDGTIVKFS